MAEHLQISVNNTHKSNNPNSNTIPNDVIIHIVPNTASFTTTPSNGATPVTEGSSLPFLSPSLSPCAASSLSSPYGMYTAGLTTSTCIGYHSEERETEVKDGNKEEEMQIVMNSMDTSTSDSTTIRSRTAATTNSTSPSASSSNSIATTNTTSSTTDTNMAEEETSVWKDEQEQQRQQQAAAEEDTHPLLPLPVSLSRAKSSIIIEDHCDSFAASLIAAVPTASAAVTRVAIPPSVATPAAMGEKQPKIYLKHAHSAEHHNPLGEGFIPPRTLSQFLCMREVYFHHEQDQQLQQPQQPSLEKGADEHKVASSHKTNVDGVAQPGLRKRQNVSPTPHRHHHHSSHTSPSASSSPPTTTTTTHQLCSESDIREERDFIRMVAWTGSEDSMWCVSIAGAAALALFLIFLFFYWWSW